MKIDVSQNAKRNIVFGVINKIVLLGLPFVSRTVMNRYLGSEYLGLNSLYASILQVLALSELGFSTALVYHMYKPITENDQKKINALLNFYRKAYFAIGCVILCLGIVLVPALPRLIKGDYPQDINITVVYLLELLSTSLSYFLFGYKQSLLVAYQREDVNSIINLCVQSSLKIIQIILLITTRSYYLFMICLPVSTCINNLWIGYITKRMFPNARCEGKLDSLTLNSIKKLVAGSFIQKACATTRNSLDSICISTFLGLTATAIYNNYYNIFNGITVVLYIAVTALTGGIGNHVIVKSVSENYDELKKLDFLYMSISGWCTVCLLCMSQPFMEIWMGEKMTFPISVVALMCLYFYMMKVGDMKSNYTSANGLWWKMKYRSIVETITNLVLNVVMGKLWGVCGIVAATTISIFICNFLWGARILFKEYFKGNYLKLYYLYHAKYFIVTAVVSCGTYFVCSIARCNGAIQQFFVNAVICLFVPTGLYFVVYGRSEIFQNSVKMVIKKRARKS